MKRALFAFASALCAIFVLAGIGTAQFNPNAPTPTMPTQPGLLAPQTGNTNIGIPSQNIPGGRDVTKTPEASDNGTKKKGLPGPSTAGRPSDGKKTSGAASGASKGVGTRIEVKTPTPGPSVPAGSSDPEDSRPVAERLKDSPPQTQGATGGATPDTSKSSNQFQRPASLLPQPDNGNVGIPSQNIPGARDVTKSDDDDGSKKGRPGQPVLDSKESGLARDVPLGKKKTPASEDTRISPLLPAVPTREKDAAIGGGQAPGDSGIDVDKLGTPGSQGASLPAGSQLPIDPDALIPPGFPQIKQLLDFLKDGPLTAGNLPGGPSGSDRPEFPKTTQPKGPKGGLPMTIGGAPAPFENPSGQASQDGGWVQTGKTEKTNDGGTRTEWKHSKTGETKMQIRHDKSKDEGSTSTQTNNPRTGASVHVEREQYRDKDGKLVRRETTLEKQKTSGGWKNVETTRWYDMKGRETNTKRKVWMPNEGGGRSIGGIICFTELQCQAAMKKAQEEAKKLPGPGGMPTETAGTGASRGRGTVPGDVTDPNPENLGGSGGGGGRSGPPIYCVGEDCERASGSGGGTPPVPGAPPG